MQKILNWLKENWFLCLVLLVGLIVHIGLLTSGVMVTLLVFNIPTAFNVIANGVMWVVIANLLYRLSYKVSTSVMDALLGKEEPEQEEEE